MAQFLIQMYSNSLRRAVSLQATLPTDSRAALFPQSADQEPASPLRMLLLLHGYTGIAENWVRPDLIEKYHLAVICPSGENSFWLDAAPCNRKFCTFVSEELPDFISRTFRIDLKREETGVLGLSMGGFGALHTALNKPELFGWCGAMSSALIVHEVSTMKPGRGNDIADYDYYRECFGDPEKVLDSLNNPETQLLELRKAGRPLPEIYMCCGTEDFLLENNRELHRFMEENHFPHLYIESPGRHDMRFWQEYTEKILKWRFEREN